MGVSVAGLSAAALLVGISGRASVASVALSRPLSDEARARPEATLLAGARDISQSSGSRQGALIQVPPSPLASSTLQALQQSSQQFAIRDNSIQTQIAEAPQRELRRALNSVIRETTVTTPEKTTTSTVETPATTCDAVGLFIDSTVGNPLIAWAITSGAVKFAILSSTVSTTYGPATVEASPGGAQSATYSGFLLSDVSRVVTINSQQVATIFNDNGRVTLSLVMKDPAVTPSNLNAVTFTHYRVTYRRTDGRNTEGVDVPYSFDSGVSLTVLNDTAVSVGFELDRWIRPGDVVSCEIEGVGILSNTIVREAV